MDEIVREAMARWPNVPAVFGWLQLDRHGRWQIKGEPITNAVVNTFICRNYLSDDEGRWYFQNGPQRVFVELEYTPLVYRLWRNIDGTLVAEAHTGEPLAEPVNCWLDDEGGALIEGEQGVGCVESQSLAVLETAFCDNKGQPLAEHVLYDLLAGNASALATARLNFGDTMLRVGFVKVSDVAARFGFKPAPQPAPGQGSC